MIQKIPLRKEGLCQGVLAVNQQEIYKGLLCQGFPDSVVYINSCIHSFNSYLLNAYFVIGTMPLCPLLPYTRPPPQPQKSIVLCNFHLDKFILTILLHLFHSGSTCLGFGSIRCRR